MSHLFNADVAEQFPDYLRDESRRSGRADTISFAGSDEDVITVLRSGQPVTTQGARTGITGGAVPDGGHILNLSRMTRITGLRAGPGADEFFIRVQPGLPLSELRAVIRSGNFDTTGWSAESLAALDVYRQSAPVFFPPDPTETSASIGGMVACNASGACTYRYGATRAYVEALRIILMDGAVLSLRRGHEKAEHRAFSVTTLEGRVLRGVLPDYPMPAVKNASGFYVRDNMDLLDLFVGSEGTLGVFTEIELRLIRSPVCRWGVMTFFPSDSAALGFVEAVRNAAPDQRPVAIEYFDSHSLDLLRRGKAAGETPDGFPEIPSSYYTAVYLEFHGDEDHVMSQIAEVPRQMTEAGGDDSATWIADSDRELERLKIVRHAVPEMVNRVIDERRKQEPGLTKLGTDMAVPDAELSAMMDLYRNGLAGAALDYVIFGHIGNNHVHVNILPGSLEEYDRGKGLYLEWARRVIQLGGTISAEHGVGKFKVALLREMLGGKGIAQMREVKRVFDPAGLLNRGTLFG